MINVSADASASNRRVVSSSVNAVVATALPDDGKADVLIATDDDGAANVSILAHQLSDAATRAEARGGVKNADMLGPITGDSYFANKAQHDAQIPNARTPELLARARQATDFVNGSDSNPFKGLSRDQLELIANDEGGPFTINERRAAWKTLLPMISPTVSSAISAPINGRDIMISRLFGGREPPVALPPATSYNTTQSASEFLNHDDRALISDLYAYAQTEGADLRYVDRLVRALGTYRNYSDGRQLANSNIAQYDADRYKLSFDFKPEDAAIASRILNGSAISSTRLDQGFLRYILDPGHGCSMNVGGIPFLERLVNKFSDEGADQTPLGSEFGTFNGLAIEDHIVRTVHKDIRLAPDRSITTCTDGVWALTELGKAEGYRLDTTNGRLSKPTALPDNPAQQPLAEETPTRTLMESLSDTPDPPATRWVWPAHLFMMLKNFKP